MQIWKKILIGGVIVVIVGVATGGVALLVGTTVTAAVTIGGIAAVATSAAMGAKEYMNQTEIDKYKKDIRNIKIENEQLKQSDLELNASLDKISLDYETTRRLLHAFKDKIDKEKIEHADEIKQLYSENSQLQMLLSKKYDAEEDALDQPSSSFGLDQNDTAYSSRLSL